MPVPRGRVLSFNEIVEINPRTGKPNTAVRNRDDKGRYPMLDKLAKSKSKKVEPVSPAQRKELLKQVTTLRLVAKYFTAPTGEGFKFAVKLAGNYGVAAEIAGRAQSAVVENISMRKYEDISTDQKLLSWSFGIVENQWKSYLDHTTQNRTIKTQEFSPVMDEITSPESVWDGRHFHSGKVAEDLRGKAEAEAEAAKNIIKVEAVGGPGPEYREEKPPAPISGNSWSGVKDRDLIEPTVIRDRSGFGPVTMAGSDPIENKHLDPRCIAGPWTIFDIDETLKEVTTEDYYLSHQQYERKQKDIYDMRKYYQYLLRNFNRLEFDKLLAEMTHVERFQAEHSLSKMRREAGEDDVHVMDRGEYDRADKAARARDAAAAGKVNPSTAATRRSRAKQWKEAAE